LRAESEALHVAPNHSRNSSFALRVKSLRRVGAIWSLRFLLGMMRTGPLLGALMRRAMSFSPEKEKGRSCLP
jgi:hypothetical protein